MLKNITTILDLNDLYQQIEQGKLTVTNDFLKDLINKANSFYESADETEKALLHAIKFNVLQILEHE